PEDVEVNPKTGKVYVMLTNNSKRKPEQVDLANPRAHNVFGHIVELTPPNGDHAAAECKWETLIKAGDPRVPEVEAQYNERTSANGWFASPDNCAIDHQGRLWVGTDQGPNWGKTGTTDGMYAVETEGELRGLSKLFYRVPVGAEICGPEFTPDDKTLFIAVQHPAADGAKSFKGFERVSTFEDPATRWPDFDDRMPARPSVVAITKKDGGVIGSA
uniref:PhoX family protein n=1 Tax=Candidatus Entotheonella palauensis TaxID=93172 RepID=UPI001177B7B4